MTRMPAEQRRQQIINVTSALAGRAKHRSDVTAAKVAAACGISEAMLWRLASREFRQIRDALPGGAATEGLVVELRTALRQERTESARLRQMERQHAKCPTTSDVETIIKLNEQLEDDNRALRASLNDLKARLELRGSGRLIVLPRQPDDG